MYIRIEHKCPICGNKHFFVTAEVSQEWEVDEFGEIVKRPVSEEVVSWPQDDPNSIWKCTRCKWKGPEIVTRDKGISLRKHELITAAFLSQKYANPILPQPIHFERKRSLYDLFDMANTKCSVILMEPVTHEDLRINFLLWQLCDEVNEKVIIKKLKSYDQNGYVPVAVSINGMPVPMKDRAYFCSIKDVVEYAQKNVLEGKYKPTIYIAGIYTNQDISPTWTWAKSMDGRIRVWIGPEPFEPSLNVYKVEDIDGSIVAERVSLENPMFPGSTYMKGPSKLFVSDEDAKVIRSIVKEFRF